MEIKKRVNTTHTTHCLFFSRTDPSSHSHSSFHAVPGSLTGIPPAFTTERVRYVKPKHICLPREEGSASRLGLLKEGAGGEGNLFHPKEKKTSQTSENNSKSIERMQ